MSKHITFALQQAICCTLLHSHIVLKQKKCAFFHVFTIISSVTTPSSRKKKWRPRKMKEHAWDDAGDRERNEIPTPKSVLSQCSLQKKSLFRNVNLTIGCTGAWITKPNSLNISLADVKGILEGRALEDGSWLILRHVQLESHVDAWKNALQGTSQMKIRSSKGG